MDPDQKLKALILLGLFCNGSCTAKELQQKSEWLRKYSLWGIESTLSVLIKHGTIREKEHISKRGAIRYFLAPHIDEQIGELLLNHLNQQS